MRKIKRLNNKKTKWIATLWLVGFGLITPMMITSCSQNTNQNNLPTYYTTKDNLVKAFYNDLSEWWNDKNNPLAITIDITNPSGEIKPYNWY